MGTNKGKENGHEWVDLGLPSGTLWATCNVGADEPEEYGDYFAWGETDAKSSYDWDIYKYGFFDFTQLTNFTQLTKYNIDFDYGITDCKTILELADDAAYANWGGKWRIPTNEEWKELRDNCTWIWTDDYNDTGVSGRIVTSKINGNSIFLPAAGYYRRKLLFADSKGCYWSSSLCTGNSNYAWDAYFNWNNDIDEDIQFRFHGLSVRPVLK